MKESPVRKKKKNKKKMNAFDMVAVKSKHYGQNTWDWLSVR